jgi:hypothetical protein
MTVATITEGLSLQGKFYSFRGALKRAVEKAAIMPRDYIDASMEKNKQALQWAENTICWVDRKHVPSTVRFCHKDQHPTSAMLRKLLTTRVQTELHPSITQQLAESAKRLLEEQGKLTTTEKTEPETDGGKYG